MTLAYDTSSVIAEMNAFHAGRNPELVKRKFKLDQEDLFAFYRGTAFLFYKAVPQLPVVLETPLALVCGDLHLENFGTFKGDNDLVYFDLNDFDESFVAPLGWEILRFLTSIYAGKESLGLSREEARESGAKFLETYLACLRDGKPRWLEQATAVGPVKDLIKQLKDRTQKDLLDSRTTKDRKLRIDGKHALLIDPGKRKAVEAALEGFSLSQPQPKEFQVLDVAVRIAGNGSLGVERYVVLVEGGGSPNGCWLLDLKKEEPSVLASYGSNPQSPWQNEAERVVSIQQIVQCLPPALHCALLVGGQPFVLKELQPSEDRLQLEHIEQHHKQWEQILVSMAELTAWGQLRGASRFGAASVEQLQAFAEKPDWSAPLLELAESCFEIVKAQWKAFQQA